MLAALITIENIAPSPGSYNPLCIVGTISGLQRQVVLLRLCGAKCIVVAGGTNRDALVRHLSHMGVICLPPSWGSNHQPLQNLEIGLSYLSKLHRFSRIVFTPAANPLVAEETIMALLACSSSVAMPLVKGVPGYPVLLRKNVLPKILGEPDEGRMPLILELCRMENGFVTSDDLGAILNLQQEEDWKSLLDRHRLTRLRPETKVSIACETNCCGPGIRMLLTILDESHSLRTACEQMGLSYSKGLRMVENMEQQLGFSVVESKQGGQYGGYSRLTAKGKEFLTTYNAYEMESKEAVKTIFKKYFG